MAEGPPQLVRLNPEAFNIVVTHVSSNKLTGYLTDAYLKVSKKVVYDIERLEKQKILDLMFEVIDELIKSASQEVPALGVVVHGPVKAREGVSVFAPNIGWRNVPIKKLVQERFKKPVCVENDVRAMGLGEFYYGSGKGVDNLVFLKIGYGIGSAIIFDGKIFRGISDSAGEFGHTTVDIGGPRCNCGNYGCLEALSSENAIVKAVVKDLKAGRMSLVRELCDGNLEKVTPDHVYRAADRGDELSLSVLQEAARYLGIGIANIINSINPKVIVIGGGYHQGPTPH